MDTRTCVRCGLDTRGRKVKRGKYGPVLDHYCRECRNALLKIHRVENLAKGLCVCGRVLATRTNCAKCRDQEATRRQEYQNLCFQHYGTACFCCGETIREFLTMDHIYGGGSKHKRERKCDIYRWLVKHNFPDGYRTACFNCNCSRGRCGYCPHERT